MERTYAELVQLIRARISYLIHQVGERKKKAPSILVAHPGMAAEFRNMLIRRSHILYLVLRCH
jgi:hypothetical protein